jgi:hypothetical protein
MPSLCSPAAGPSASARPLSRGSKSGWPQHEPRWGLPCLEGGAAAGAAAAAGVPAACTSPRCGAQQLPPPGPRRGLYECDSCKRDISDLVRVRCAVCPDYDLCLECFSVGAEVHPHKASHAYRVIEPLAFPVYQPDWRVSQRCRGGVPGPGALALWCVRGWCTRRGGRQRSERAGAAPRPARAPGAG